MRLRPGSSTRSGSTGRHVTALAAAVLVCSCASETRRTEGDPSTLTILADADDYILRLYEPKYFVFLPLAVRHGSEAEPRLAESWEHSPDFRTWTFYLRRDVRWHDGVPVTAHDVAFSLELFAHPDVLFPARGLAFDLDSVSVPDDYTVTVELTRPRSPTDVPGGWTVYFPKHLLEGLDPAGFYEWGFWKQPVGNGPYRFVRHIPRTLFELEANPDFYAGEPSIPRIIVKLGGASPVVELTSGASDVAYLLGPADVFALQTDDRFQPHVVFDWSELQALYWNQRHPLLADARVRRALGRAIDRRQLARLLDLPEDMPLLGGLSPEGRIDDPYRTGGWDQGPEYDPDGAGRLLDEAGWVDRTGDGVREKAGDEARFTVLVASGGLVRGEQQALYIQGQLRSVGVAMDIRPVEGATLFDLFRSGSFDAVIANVDNTPDGILEKWLTPPSPLDYREPELSRLLEALLEEPDPAAQDTLYARVNAILRRDAPVTFLFPMAEWYVTRRQVRGFRPGWSIWLGYPEELRIVEDGR